MKVSFKFILFLFILSVSASAAIRDTSSIYYYQLKADWTFKQADSANWYPANVPGCVHTDLMNNKLIDDPFFGTNEQKQQWIGKTDWDYKTTFNVPDNLLENKNIELIFDGLDTYADVYLNDVLVLSADNMFRTWKIPCKNLLKPAGNVLRIHFKNVFEVDMPKMENAPFKLLDSPNCDQSDTMLAMYSRKAQFHYGWDWGPRLITCGIWKDVYLEGWNEFKIENVGIVQKNVSKDKADISATINVKSDVDKLVLITAKVDGFKYVNQKFQLKKGENAIPAVFEMKNPDLWWTNGLGKQYLYIFNFNVRAEDGYNDSNIQKIGIRSLEIIRDKDSLGRSFYVKLNGIPVFMKGANYIPQDNFQNRVTSERYEHMIKSAADAHMNILRVWGGGIYENNEFYEMCDKYGVLVWQEFIFACSMYPADSLFLDNVKNEVLDNVTRIRNHACLALYCGNNENVVGWYNWGWKKKYPPNIQAEFENGMHKLYNETIPNAIRELDSTRYYLYTSPSADFNGVTPAEGDIHYWGVWHGKEPFENFNKNIARFVSEYGFQSYPEYNAIKKFTAPEEMQLHSETMLSHQRCMADNRKDKEYGNRLIQWYMERQYKKPKDFESFLYTSQVLQAEGIKAGIEAHRRNMPFCMGTMYWQLDDCWPAASWSSIDYYGNWKALQYYAKREYGTFLLSFVKGSNKVNIFIVSDSTKKVRCGLQVVVLDFSGKVIYNGTFNVDVRPNACGDYFAVDESILKGADKSKIVVVAQLRLNGNLLAENNYLYKEIKDLNFEKPDIKLQTRKTTGGYLIRLLSDKFAKDVYLSSSEDLGFFSDNYFDLLPGLARIIKLETKKDIDNLINRLKVTNLSDM
ncbi:MAG: hypothetical protein P4L45_02690 [Ignavibacteriaceae bacterium]|nr:hypothetical protein [Ignavibacteriaceae bacterium]